MKEGIKLLYRVADKRILENRYLNFINLFWRDIFHGS